MAGDKNNSKSTLLLALLLIGAATACNLSKGVLGGSTMYEGNAMLNAAAAFKQKLGGSFKALSVQINSGSATLRAQDPKTAYPRFT